MKNPFLIAVALTLVLAGCASVRVGPAETIKVGERTITLAGLNGFDAAAVRRPDPHNPNVFIAENQRIVVDQEPVRPTNLVGGRIYIGWALDSVSEYSFPDDNAISFAAGTGNPLPTGFACTAHLPKKKVIVCGYDKPAQAAQWKYTVRVADRTGKELTRLDPWVHQN